MCKMLQLMCKMLSSDRDSFDVYTGILVKFSFVLTRWCCIQGDPWKLVLFGFVFYSLIGLSTYTSTHAWWVRCCSSCVRCWDQTMMHSDFDCRQMRSLWFGRGFGCSCAFRCFSEGCFLFTWQPPVVVNPGISQHVLISMFWGFLYGTFTPFCSNVILVLTGICSVWRLVYFVVLCCVCLDTIALDLNVEMRPCGWCGHQQVCTFRDVFRVG